MPRIAQFWLAAGLTLLVNLIVWFIAFNLVGIAAARVLAPWLENLLSVLLFGIGLGQALYLLPVAVYLGWQRRWLWVQGLTVGAVLTFLLNGGCWLLIFQGF